MNTEQTDVVTDNESYEINLGDEFLGPDLSDFVVKIQDIEYNGIPINKDMFPIYVNGHCYNGHLRYSKEDVELIIVKGANGQMRPNEGSVSYSIKNLEPQYADSFVLYVIGLLRKV